MRRLGWRLVGVALGVIVVSLLMRECGLELPIL